MALHAQIPSVEAQRAIVLAQGIGAVLGGGSTLSRLVDLATGNPHLAASMAASSYMDRECR